MQYYTNLQNIALVLFELVNRLGRMTTAKAARVGWIPLEDSRRAFNLGKKPCQINDYSRILAR